MNPRAFIELNQVAAHDRHGKDVHNHALSIYPVHIVAILDPCPEDETAKESHIGCYIVIPGFAGPIPVRETRQEILAMIEDLDKAF